MANELAIINTNDYAVSTVENFDQTIRDNMGDEPLKLSDLSRVKTPAGGGLSWEIPGIGGEEFSKELEGVIVHHTGIIRGYWRDESVVGGPPTCGSLDGVTGTGEPGGACYACPLARFQDGEKPLCRESRLIYVIRRDDMLPIVIKLSQTSLKGYRAFCANLTRSNIPRWACVTRFSLDAKENIKKQKYSVVVPTIVGKLDPSTAQKFRAIGQTIAGVEVVHDSAD